MSLIKKQWKTRFRLIHLLFLSVCVFSLMSLYTASHVTLSSFSDTESIHAIFVMGPGACVHGQGFWRHHPEEWPVENITVGGILYSKDEAIVVMNTPGAGDKTYDMFRQVASTMLNLFNGCDPSCIQEVVTLADNWLVMYPVGSDVHANSQAWKQAKQWHQQLGQYNDGLLCEEACNTPPDPPQRHSTEESFPVLSVFVSDVDYDELTVRFYTVQDCLLGEQTMVESDITVSLNVQDEVALDDSFGWYVIVADQHTQTESEIWWFTDAVNETNSTDDEPPTPGEPGEFLDMSPATAGANMMYMFEVQANTSDLFPEMMVVYWYNDSTRMNLMLSRSEQVWTGSIIIAQNMMRLWYQVYLAFEPGLWQPLPLHEVIISDESEVP